MAKRETSIRVWQHLIVSLRMHICRFLNPETIAFKFANSRLIRKNKCVYRVQLKGKIATFSRSRYCLASSHHSLVGICIIVELALILTI